MASYSVDQLFNKSLLAKQKIPVYKLSADFEDKKKPVYVIEPGKFTPPIYSYVYTPKNKILMLQFLYQGKGYYIPMAKGLYDEKSIKDQGAKSDEDMKKEKEGGELWEKSKLEYFIKTYGIWVIVGVGIISLSRRTQ